MQIIGGYGWKKSRGALINIAIEGGEDMLSLEDMVELTAAEGKRLGVNSPEFMERHNEIMKMADDIQSRYKKKAPISTANNKMHV